MQSENQNRPTEQNYWLHPRSFRKTDVQIKCSISKNHTIFSYFIF